jgi:hypothetical protein
VVEPELYAQNRFDVEDGIGCPFASSFGNGEPGEPSAAGTTKSPTAGSELVNE